MVKLNPVLYRDKCTCTSAIEWFNFLSYKRLSCVLQKHIGIGRDKRTCTAVLQIPSYNMY